ncbi:IS66 family transposase [Microcoleus sp. herbarium19]|uniref:IS66 family transposase n=1 Tax=unclassified Microcoleus TaxID=2642155 RepID=UPI002FD256EF
MSEKPELSAALKLEIVDQLSREELVKIVLTQQKLIEKLQAELEKLKERQPSNSKTSSKPPSSDLIQKSELAKVDNSKELEKEPKPKPGGQPGHIGKTRKGFGRVDRYQISTPDSCEHCGSRELSDAMGYSKQQVACLVARPIEVVEYQRVKCQCLECGAMALGPVSPGIVAGQDLSIDLQALLVWLGNYGHLSYEKQQELLRELGGIEIGIGTLQATNARLANAVKPAIEALWKWAPLQPSIHVDETPWCVKGVKEWLWTATGKDFCLFHAADTRSRAELETMLGSEFAGVLSSDDFSVYNGVIVGAQQKCLAHLRRHFKKILQMGHGNDTVVAEAFLELIDEAFRQHRKWREQPEELDYHTWARDFKVRLAELLNTWQGHVGYAAGLLLRSLREKAHQWWYFLDHPSIPPDNNLAERSLRLAVTKRKVSGGSRSMSRFEQTADLLSVIQTCRFQGIRAIDFFRDALSAHYCNLFMPSLIPQSKT